MPLRPLPLLRRRRTRPWAHHRYPRISCCGLCRTGNLRRSHSPGADGRCGLGSSAFMGRRCHFRWQTVARRSGYCQCWLSVPTVLRRRPTARKRRPTPPMAPRCPHHRRGRTTFRLPRECRPSSPPRFSRGRCRTGRHGLQACGRPLYGGGSRRAPSARTVVHSRHPRGLHTGRPRAPALGPGRVAGIGRNCCASGPRRGPAPTRTGRRSPRPRRQRVSMG